MEFLRDSEGIILRSCNCPGDPNHTIRCLQTRYNVVAMCLAIPGKVEEITTEG